jgi:hypothetical protein
MGKTLSPSMAAVMFLFICIQIPTQSMASAPSSTAGDLLQFKAGNHILGFARDKAYLASTDHALSVRFLGAEGVMPKADANAPAKGVITKTSPLGKIVYQNLWDGISLTYEAAKDGITESTYHVAPGSDVSKIRLSYNVPVEMKKDGSLNFKFETGNVSETAPIAWQDIDGTRKAVEVAFRIKDGAVGFSVGNYDRTLPLTIDPTYKWHTFYGSNGDYDENVAYGITTDAGGNIYVTGRSEGTWNGEGNTPPKHPYSGSKDIFVLKLNSSGAHQWHTFYGSEYDDDSGNDIVVDTNGNVYVTGWSNYGWDGDGSISPLNPFSGNADLFVLKLNNSGAYQWHTFYGSTTYADQGMGIAVDSYSGVYIAGGSIGSWRGPGWEEPKHPHGGKADILVLKLDSGGGYKWHTFYGSTENESGRGIALDGNMNIYITGYGVASWNGSGDILPKHPFSSAVGVDDIIVLKLDNNGAYQWHTFYGCSDEDYAYRVATDVGGNVYICGGSTATWSGPTGQTPLHSFSGGIFLLKLDVNGVYQWHSFYGGGKYDEAEGLALDTVGNIYLTGTSQGWNGPGGELPLHSGGQITVIKLDSGGAYKWHTFYGSDTSNYAFAVAVDPGGSAYAAGLSYAETWNGDGGALPLQPFAGLEHIFVLKLNDSTGAIAPTVTTTDISAITSTTASGGGNVTTDGGGSVTARGVCWATSANPTVSASHTSNGIGTGSFTCSITGLSPVTTYFVRAYASNSGGTGYGDNIYFITLCPSYVAKIGTTGYGTLQEAVNAVVGTAEIRAVAGVRSVALNISGNRTVTLLGGYDCVCGAVTGMTTVNGSITISGSATVTMGNVAVY